MQPVDQQRPAIEPQKMIPGVGVEAVKHAEHTRAGAVATAVVLRETMALGGQLPAVGHGFFVEQVCAQRLANQPDDVHGLLRRAALYRPQGIGQIAVVAIHRLQDRARFAVGFRKAQ